MKNTKTLAPAYLELAIGAGICFSGDPGHETKMRATERQDRNSQIRQVTISKKL